MPIEDFIIEQENKDKSTFLSNQQDERVIESIVSDEDYKTLSTALTARIAEEIDTNHGGLKTNSFAVSSATNLVVNNDCNDLDAMLNSHTQGSHTLPSKVEATRTNEKSSSVMDISEKTIDEQLIDNGLEYFANTLLSSNPISIAKKAEEYFIIQDSVGKPYSFTGMLIHIGFDGIEEFNEYEKIVGFSRIVKRAKLRCANYIEEAMLTGTIQSNTGAFLLKSIYEWRDNQEININNRITDNSTRVKLDVEVLDAISTQIASLGKV